MRSRVSFPAPLVLIFILALTGCQAAAVSPGVSSAPTISSTPTLKPSPTPVPIQIDVNDVRQTIRQIGSGNFIHRYSGLDTPLEPVSQLNLDIFQPLFARVDIHLARWEPENDNADPGKFDFSAFNDSGDVHGTNALIELLYDRGVEITASVWEVPDWMVEDPDMDSARVIPPALYPEVVESLAAWLIHARQEYGVEVAYISFNEANLGINVLLNPHDVIALVKLAGPRFAELGLKTKWLLGDCSNVRDCLAYIQPIWAEESIRQYLGPLAFHSWDVLSVTDPRLEEIAAFALENGLEVRCTEAGWDAALWQRSEEFPGWNNALRLAIVYSRVLKLSRATTMYYWEMFAQDYNLNDGQEPYPAMNVLRLFNDLIPPGSQIVGASPNGSNRHILAAKTPQGMVLFIVNASLKETARVAGLPDGKYELVILHDKDRQGTSQVISINNGSIELELPGFGILMLAQQS